MQKISDFEVLRELGRGGMGIVYEAVEQPLNRKVALKLLHPHWASQPDISARFVDEARKIAKLSHRDIVKIHRFGQVDDTYFLALEYVDGLPLDTYLAKNRLTVIQAVDVLKAVAGALGYAHDSGIVHRDVKPGNIFLRADNSVVLGDFGIAKDLNIQGITQTGEVIGTPAYMSPEQAGGKPITPATDVYALGVMAFEMFTGRVPFTADTPVGLLMKHINEQHPPIIDLAPNLPEPLADVVKRMLEKDPSRRPANGNEIVRLLTDFQSKLKLPEQTEKINPSKESGGSEPRSYFDEMEITLACFELVGFSRETCQNLLPARVAFLLESWYRLVRQAVHENGGIVDRYVADRVTTIFGYPNRHLDHVHRALLAAGTLKKALADFNQAHDLDLKMRAGIACGPVLIGHIVGDVSSTSLQGWLPGEMQALSKTKAAEPPIRLNRAAYRRVSDKADFISIKEPVVGELWGTYL